MSTLTMLGGGGESACKTETPNYLEDTPIAVIAFVLMMMAFAGQLVMHGHELRWLRQDEENPDPTKRHTSQHGSKMFLIFLAIIAEILAAVFYYRQVKRCHGMKGFFVFILITALATFFVAGFATVPPPPPPPSRCHRAER